MLKHGASLETEPVSVHAPYISYSDGQDRFEDAEERYAALLEPLRGVALGSYDLRILRCRVGHLRSGGGGLAAMAHPPRCCTGGPRRG